jgi:putative iron-regulated protein
MFKLNLHSIYAALPISFLLLASSCTKPTTTPVADYNPTLASTGNEVIIKTYKDLDDKAGILVNVLTVLATTPTTANFEAARQAWRDTRVPWEQSEGFLFGPVDTQGLDPSMDSWPVNVVDLDNVLASSNALTKAYLDQSQGTLKGFHTLEYLLFGVNGDKQITAFTPREYAYLAACAQALKGTTAQLYAGWLPTQGNFIKNFANAGTTNSIYPSQKAALQELVNGMTTICDEVANGKIQNPYAQQDITLEESRFSANSKRDFADNIRSIRNIYVNNNNTTSIQNLVKAKNSTLDAKIMTQIDAAIASIEAIPGTFTTAITNNRPAVQTAQTKTRDLFDTLQGELLPLVQGL